ncbi:MIP/aquaporin family protein [Algicola sagamiensis]|uniref:MIP/aquaporin family protein n=1 Tax=Algicola sagamiensis TaxID=163869 RepID=UPI00037E269D|nr:MIP family channel protein [Algicola sagamiensis]
MKLKHLIAEILGTFMLVFAGTGAVVINQASGGAITHIGIALVFGLIVTVVVYTYGESSGAHINPAVTIALWLSKRFPGASVVPYIIAQCIGAIAASMLLSAMYPANESLGGTIPSIPASYAFIFELLLTWWLMTVILHVTVGEKEKVVLAGAIIGGVVALEALFAGPATGASMNPARSLGPALISGQLSHIWLYILAPILGASLAVFTYALTTDSNANDVNEVEEIPEVQENNA